MNRYDRKIWGLAACFAALAGYVDAVGFLYLGGFFVSFMSGNSTRLAVGLSTHLSDAATAAGLIASFVIGVMLGSLCGRVIQHSRHSALMYLIAALLMISAILAIIDANWAVRRPGHGDGSGKCTIRARWRGADRSYLYDRDAG